MKWKLGDTSGLRARTNVKASLRPRLLANMRYASVIVTDYEEAKKKIETCKGNVVGVEIQGKLTLDTPARQ